MFIIVAVCLNVDTLASSTSYHRGFSFGIKSELPLPIHLCRM